MIRVVTSSLGELKATPFPEAILRSVSASLEADTPFSREVELRFGRGLTERLQAMGELPMGAAVITPGGDLPCDFIIHLVLHSDEEKITPVRLRRSLENGLRRAGEWGIESLLLPPLGTGAGNLDAQEAAQVMVPVLSNHVESTRLPLDVLVLAGSAYEGQVFSDEVEALLGRTSGRERDGRPGD